MKIPSYANKARAEYEQLVESMHEGNPDYDEFLVNLRRQASSGQVQLSSVVGATPTPECAAATLPEQPKITPRRTDFYNFGVEKHGFSMFMAYRPPIAEAPESERILVCGTKAQLREIASNEEATVKASKLATPTTKFQYSANMGYFWENFFGNKHFLDNSGEISVPRGILATGWMRNYDPISGTGMTLGVWGLLEDIAKEWDIPLEQI